MPPSKPRSLARPAIDVCIDDRARPRYHLAILLNDANAMYETVSTARAIADPNRMRVLAVLMQHEELCVCQITALLNLATPTVSRHMSILRGALLVHSRKHGRWVYYRLSPEFPPLLRQWLVESLSGSPETEADLASLQRVLACDPGEICRCQRTRRVAPNGREGT